MLIEILTYVAAGALFLQLVYQFNNLIRIAGFKKQKGAKPRPVSVIVCAHNELDNLKELVPLLTQQDHPDFEIIIVDDRSDDGTYDYLLEHKNDQIKQVTVNQVYDHINAKKYAITLGIKAAQHETLLFTDADCRPVNEQWIKNMTNTFTKDKHFLLGVSQYERRKGFLAQFIRFETLMTAINYIGFALSGNPYMAVGRNLVYRKSTFLDNKGFNKYQHVTGGDDDLLVNQLARKKTTAVAIGAEALTLSIPKKTWGSYFRQKVRHISVSKHYRFVDKMLLGLQNLSHSLFWVALISLAVISQDYIITGALLSLRIITMLILAGVTSKKFGDRMNLWLIPFMDILYVPFVALVGTRAIFTKKVKWK